MTTIESLLKKMKLPTEMLFSVNGQKYLGELSLCDKCGSVAGVNMVHAYTDLPVPPLTEKPADLGCDDDGNVTCDRCC